MSIRQRFEERIRRKEQEIQELEAKIREAKAYIQALQDSIKILPRDEAGGVSTGELLRPGSTNAKVYELLKKTGKPMHVIEILAEIGKPNNKKNRLSLSGALGSYVRKREIFTRPAPNTFGLIITNAVSEEPPDDFGLADDKKEDDIPF
jgi:predicted RNase H-like nuclease (RuvC/YqgF family)